MSQSIAINQASVYEHIYDRYSAKLYGIILKIAENKKEAEEILIRSFSTFFRQRLFMQDNGQIFRHLLQITIEIAAERSDSTKHKIGQYILKELGQQIRQVQPGIK